MARGRILKNGVPVADLLAAKLRRRLQTGRVEPGAFVASECELARTEGVNRMLVRQAVDALIREGKLQRRPGRGVYVPEAVRGVRETGRRVVQVIVPNLKIAMCVDIAQGAKEAGAKAGVQTQIYDAHRDLHADVEMVRRLPESSAQGAILASVHHKRFAETLYELKAAGYPFVLVDETLRDVEVPSVVADNYQGGLLAGRKLLEYGHRRISFLSFLGADTTQRRLEGLRDAMADHGLVLPRAFIGKLRVQGMDDWSSEIDRVLREMLGRADRPTAIFFSPDTAAAIGYRTIRAMGLRIPEDVSIVGFDGDPVCRLLTPTLATVRQPTREMGIVAMEMLLALMDGDPTAGGSRMQVAVVSGAACTPVAVVSRVACTPVTVRGGSKTNGPIETQAWGQGNGHGSPETQGHGDESQMARTGKLETGKQPGAWHRILPVTWQDGDSLGPAPGAAGDFTIRDTKATDGSRSPGRLSRAAKGADDIRIADREMVEA